MRVDGQLLDEEGARALWQRFSEHMEANKGDLAGFAAKEGYASVRPGMENGRAVLIASRSAPQVPYASVKEERGGGGGGGGAQRAKNKRRS